MLYQIITIIAGLLTLLGYVLNIYKKRVCFWIWIGGNMVWLASCLIILNLGLVLNNVVFLLINYLGWRKWKKDDIKGALDRNENVQTIIELIDKSNVNAGSD